VPKVLIQTDDAGPPLGAYSQGFRAGDFIYVTGCGPIDPRTAAVSGSTIEEQTNLAISNVEAILRAGGATLDDVIKTTVHLQDTLEFEAFNAAYSERFAEPRPVRTTVGSDMGQVPGMRIEIDVVAYVGR
jgi:2-iminobutanoate/2-iminopropanoate deaminase